MIKKIFAILLCLFVFPCLTLCKEFSIDGSNILYEIDEEKWHIGKTNIKGETQHITYSTDDTILSLGYYDCYETEYMIFNTDRKYINYKNIISSDKLIDSKFYMEYIKHNFSANSIDEVVNYNMSFNKFSRTIKLDNSTSACELYYTVNNGYNVILMFCEIPNGDRDNFNKDVVEVLSSLEISGEILEYEGNQQSFVGNFLIYFFKLFVIYTIGYMIFPFFKYKIIKKDYDEDSLKKTLIINSVVIFLIDCVLCIFIKHVPDYIDPFVFFYINKFIYNQKLKKRDKSMRHEGFEDI